MKKLIQTVCILVVLATLMAASVNAAETSTRSSAYIASYRAYLTKTSSTTVAICFDITGCGRMEEIGAFSICVQRSKDGSSWTDMQTYSYADFPQMYGEDVYTYSGSMIYTGEKGYYYRAIITLYAKNSSGVGMEVAYTDKLLLPNTGRLRDQ